MENSHLLHSRIQVLLNQWQVSAGILYLQEDSRSETGVFINHVLHFIHDHCLQYVFVHAWRRVQKHIVTALNLWPTKLQTQTIVGGHGLELQGVLAILPILYHTLQQVFLIYPWYTEHSIISKIRAVLRAVRDAKNALCIPAGSLHKNVWSNGLWYKTILLAHIVLETLGKDLENLGQNFPNSESMSNKCSGLSNRRYMTYVVRRGWTENPLHQAFSSPSAILARLQAV